MAPTCIESGQSISPLCKYTGKYQFCYCKIDCVQLGGWIYTFDIL